jgi:hypothetical protein
VEIARILVISFILSSYLRPDIYGDMRRDVAFTSTVLTDKGGKNTKARSAVPSPETEQAVVSSKNEAGVTDRPRLYQSEAL